MTRKSIWWPILGWTALIGALLVTCTASACVAGTAVLLFWPFPTMLMTVANERSTSVCGFEVDVREQSGQVRDRVRRDALPPGTTFQTFLYVAETDIIDVRAHACDTGVQDVAVCYEEYWTLWESTSLTFAPDSIAPALRSADASRPIAPRLTCVD